MPSTHNATNSGCVALINSGTQSVAGRALLKHSTTLWRTWHRIGSQIDGSVKTDDICLPKGIHDSTLQNHGVGIKDDIGASQILAI